MAQLTAGDEAPPFELEDDGGKRVTLDALRQGKLVLYFFPKADTSGWTVEALQFEERRAELEAKGVRVVGLSPDPVDALRAFQDKYSLHFTFLSDPDHATLDAYGAWGERPGRGLGVIRSTVLIGPDGRIERAWYGVKPDGHAQEVLEALWQQRPHAFRHGAAHAERKERGD